MTIHAHAVVTLSASKAAQKAASAAGAARERAAAHAAASRVEPAQATAVVVACSGRPKRKSIVPGEAPKDAPPPKRASRLSARSINKQPESIFQPASIVIQPRPGAAHTIALTTALARPFPAPALQATKIKTPTSSQRNAREQDKN